ncbi:MAG TPA: DUF1559 domain-containing protein [Gemmatales bacterium]|nr:DUF1559 domain-containing protein [Gemmatales bacterium]HMP59524.1 DUF1559 domain-containing protein [Gemmatales bacterium]
MPMSRRAFTLPELLVVIAIVGVLLALTIPAVQRARAAADQTVCKHRLRELGVALAMYHTERGRLPPGCSGEQTPTPHLSWHARLLPYLGRLELWQQTQAAFAQEKFFVKEPPHQVAGQVIAEFICPSDPRLNQAAEFDSVAGGKMRRAFTSYLGASGLDQNARDGMLFLDSMTRLADAQDGLSQTLLVGERPPSAILNLGWWYGGWGMAKTGAGEMILGVREINTFPPDHPYGGQYPPGPYEFKPGKLDDQQAQFHYWSLHLGGGHFLFADQSVRFLRYSAASILPALATRDGREPVTLPD